MEGPLRTVKMPDELQDDLLNPPVSLEKYESYDEWGFLGSAA